MPGPLASLKVVEMVGLGPCPLAGQLLADLGAEVIVIDRQSGIDLSGDINRRGKKSIALNLKESDGLKAVKAILKASDILIEGFRPGVMERLGLGPDECLKVNPALVYGRMTGWGQEGPLAHTAGHDLNYLAITGYLNAMGKDGEPPVPPLNFVADYGGGSMFLIMGVLSAVIERKVSGKGQVIDAAMIDGVPAMMGLVQSMFAKGLWTDKRQDNFIDGGAPYYRCYTCADTRYLSVGCIEPQFFAEFLKLAELDPELAKKQNDKSFWPEMHRVFEIRISQKTRDEWAMIFEGSDACVAPVLDFGEAENHSHNQARKTFVKPNGIRQTNPAPRFDRSELILNSAAGLSGAEGSRILADCGMPDDEIERLAKTGILI